MGGRVVVEKGGDGGRVARGVRVERTGERHPQTPRQRRHRVPEREVGVEQKLTVGRVLIADARTHVGASCGLGLASIGRLDGSLATIREGFFF